LVGRGLQIVVHTGEVRGSIPCAPTIRLPEDGSVADAIYAWRLFGPPRQKSRKQPHAQ